MVVSKDKKKPTRHKKPSTKTVDTTVEFESKEKKKSNVKKSRNKGATVDATLATVVEDNSNKKDNVKDAPSKGSGPMSKPMSKPATCADESDQQAPTAPKKSPTKQGVKKPAKKASKTPEVAQPPPPQPEPAEVTDYRMATDLTLQPYVEEFLRRAILRDKPIDALLADFRRRRRGNDFSKMTAFIANQGKNRYKDVGCLDNNRVVLHLGGQSYIHANYVGPSHEPRKFICCQAPLDSTIADFWHMIAQEGCRCIIMLCNYLEKNLNKCAFYLPVGPIKSQTHGLITVNIINTDRFPFKEQTKTVVNRTFLELTWETYIAPQNTSPTNSTHTARAMKHRLEVEHLHWLDWPDRGVPPADNVPIELIHHVQQYSGSPTVVHCSAGIGRTGCFVMMDILLYQYLKRIPWNADLAVLLQEIRQSRNNSIQTEQQYLYVHQVMINFLKKEGLLTPEMVKTHVVTWTPQYNKQCEAFN